jgi:hypothetical protein
VQRIALACLAVGLVFGATAFTFRAPTAKEKAAITQAIKGFQHMPQSPMAQDDTITSLAVSALDSRYAAAKLNSKTAGPSEMVLHESQGTWWVQGFGSDLQCAVAPAAVLDLLKIGCSPPNATAWINDCGPLQAKPASVVIACGDGNYSVEKITWKNWGSASATGTATASANDCKPYCAAGHFHTYPATVTATKLTKCGLAHVYAELTVAYAGARPAGVSKRDVHTLGC